VTVSAVIGTVVVLAVGVATVFAQLFTSKRLQIAADKQADAADKQREAAEQALQNERRAMLLASHVKEWSSTDTAYVRVYNAGRYAATDVRLESTGGSESARTSVIPPIVGFRDFEVELDSAENRKAIEEDRLVVLNWEDADGAHRAETKLIEHVGRSDYGPFATGGTDGPGTW
jgi:hypothetical protein